MNGRTDAYNALGQDGVTPNHSAYSNTIVLKEDFVLHISDKLSLAAVAPLLCAGIITYSLFRHWKVRKG